MSRNIGHSVGTGAAIFGTLGPHLDADQAAFFRDSDPFGFILFARNIETPAQVARLCADLRASVGRDAPILIDQEGGRVQRLRGPYWREWAPPLDTVAAAGSNAPRAMYLRAQIIAAELRALGIDANCAPVADIAGPITHPFLRNRCYGTDAASVTQIARAVADGQLAMGVLPVVKHLPGHGRADGDTHLSLPRVTASMDDLIATDFAPFAALRDLPMAMTAHIIFDALDPARPATQSPAAIAAIRDTIGFQGLLMTDDLNMQALVGDLGQRTALSMAAGCDLALHCKGDLAEMQMVAAAAGAMGQDTILRGQRALHLRSAAPDIDIAAREAEFLALTQGRGRPVG
ncbi:MAG: glycoside hydrolase family 3 N-terminal domain-containing protein [Cypionkella sp.]|nr:glycoside hydrolase family 3 N-terminal domain-containing protein [Cypionkella sp.]